VGDEVVIRRATTFAEVDAASALFDGPVQSEPTRRFLAQAGHHLLVASVGEEPVGIVSGVETTHPDKGTEMFLYELSVAEPYRGRGIATRLVTALADLARGLGCYGMWVLTDDTNAPALGAYQAAGGVRDTAPRMLTWTFSATEG
jgi:[ribosomal protein S18]-alanine N-acetyltransferase